MKTFMATTAVLALITIFVISCGKDKFQTKPKLEFKKYDKEVFEDGTLTVRINYFDKEGDLDGGYMYARLKRINKNPLTGSDFDKSDSLDAFLPTFPAKNNGEITFTETYGFLKESQSINDTIVLSFAVTDKGNNTSDTITTDPIVIHLP